MHRENQEVHHHAQPNSPSLEDLQRVDQGVSPGGTQDRHQEHGSNDRPVLEHPQEVTRDLVAVEDGLSIVDEADADGDTLHEESQQINDSSREEEVAGHPAFPDKILDSYQVTGDSYYQTQDVDRAEEEIYPVERLVLGGG